MDVCSILVKSFGKGELMWPLLSILIFKSDVFLAYLYVFSHPHSKLTMDVIVTSDYSKGSVFFNFQITFDGASTAYKDEISKDLEEEGLGNYTVDVKDIKNKNRKYAILF